MFLWSMVLVPKYFTTPVVPGSQTNAPAIAQPTGGLSPSNTTTATISAPAAPGAFVRPTFSTNTAEELLVLTNENARYTFTSQGGGVKRIELLKFPETVSSRKQSDPATNDLATLNAHAKLPVLAVLGGAAVEGDGIFSLTPTPNGVRAEKLLENGLRLVKEFQLSTNYLVNASVRLENTSSNALGLPQQEWVIGMATPMNATDDAQGVGITWYDGSSPMRRCTRILRTNDSAACPAHPGWNFGTGTAMWSGRRRTISFLRSLPCRTHPRNLSLPGRWIFHGPPPGGSATPTVRCAGDWKPRWSIPA